jgi:hypothetical protein
MLGKAAVLEMGKALAKAARESPSLPAGADIGRLRTPYNVFGSHTLITHTY